MSYSRYSTQEQRQTNNGNIGIHENIQIYHQNLPVIAHSLTQSSVKFYKIDDYIGNETRQFEFKNYKRKGNIEKKLLNGRHKRRLAAYVSGFLNSLQAWGVILVGIKDKGRVVGICCDHQKRDRLGQLISTIMRSELNPPVIPQQYSVRFVPVYDKQGVNQINDKYVLEIAVNRLVNNITELYKASGEVYRKDEGCLNGPLGSDEISKWLKLLHQIKSENNQKTKEKLEQMARENQTLELENRVLQDKLVQAEKLSRTKNSKVCVIM